MYRTFCGFGTECSNRIQRFATEIYGDSNPKERRAKATTVLPKEKEEKTMEAKGYVRYLYSSSSNMIWSKQRLKEWSRRNEVYISVFLVVLMIACFLWLVTDINKKAMIYLGEGCNETYGEGMWNLVEYPNRLWSGLPKWGCVDKIDTIDYAENICSDRCGWNGYFEGSYAVANCHFECLNKFEECLNEFEEAPNVDEAN